MIKTRTTTISFINAILFSVLFSGIVNGQDSRYVKNQDFLTRSEALCMCDLLSHIQNLSDIIQYQNSHWPNNLGRFVHLEKEIRFDNKYIILIYSVMNTNFDILFLYDRLEVKCQLANYGYSTNLSSKMWHRILRGNPSILEMEQEKIMRLYLSLYASPLSRNIEKFSEQESITNKGNIFILKPKRPESREYFPDLKIKIIGKPMHYKVLFYKEKSGGFVKVKGLPLGGDSIFGPRIIIK